MRRYVILQRAVLPFLAGVLPKRGKLGYSDQQAARVCVLPSLDAFAKL